MSPEGMDQLPYVFFFGPQISTDLHRYLRRHGHVQSGSANSLSVLRAAQQSAVGVVPLGIKVMAPQLPSGKQIVCYGKSP